MYILVVVGFFCLARDWAAQQIKMAAADAKKSLSGARTHTHTHLLHTVVFYEYDLALVLLAGSFFFYYFYFVIRFLIASLM